MKSLRRSLVVALILVLAIFSFIDYANAQQDLFPWVRFNGGFQTTAGIGTGSFVLNGIVNEMDYENGEVWTANVPGIETIKGAKIEFNGATRTGDYSFNGDPIDPTDVTLTIKTPDGTHTYMVATLTDVTFECGTASPVICWLNEGLDANIPETLNLTDIILSTNDGPTGPGSGPYPSRYIDELRAYLAASNVSGLKMSLLVPPVSIFDFTANSSGPITYGLIDGLQSLNTPPVADAGATTTNTTCLSTSCTITLNGTSSSDIDSTPGTNDDIVSFEWIENGVTIATGSIANVNLPLGWHDITLKVTDSAGATDEVTITVVIDPAELSFIDIDTVHVKHNGLVKITGRLALPAGVSYLGINSVGQAIIGISSLGNVIDEVVDFTEFSNRSKWKYDANPVFGIERFKIDWSGARFNYHDPLYDLKIKSLLIGESETSLQIKSCAAVTIDINGVTVDIDRTRIDRSKRVTCSHASARMDRDNDGEDDDRDDDHGDKDDDDHNSNCTTNVTLPFALSPDMVITITHGTVTQSISVADYYTAAVGKYTLTGRFDATGIDFSALDPNLSLTVALGDEGFSGTLVIDQATWTKIRSSQWVYDPN